LGFVALPLLLASNLLARRSMSETRPDSIHNLEKPDLDRLENLQAQMTRLYREMCDLREEIAALSGPEHRDLVSALAKDRDAD
jgi:hypothetical protein